ncbi:nuclear transport factor 2 family protein [Pedobacter sp. MR2016-24]|uniref:nuclear transport factor 2 family protein n=1 Tax=Pedobacter sp. MR2016-24 TaxID=2994466 RepID=UPI0022466ACC|nr:nuclear transport factor 2 family protein [Pedobacter sp. MR2016-24]MCX2482375.1 nuclear transport factor 2 family protein [Pedobacter sp. MR2016-24]
MMRNKIICTLIAVAFAFGAFAQRSDGTTKSLVNAEKEFAESAVKNGVKSAFHSYSANDAIVFRPNPVNAKTYYATQQNDKNLVWSPSYARVARSGDWGFTTGGFTLEGDQKVYGQYVSVWKAINGKWELVIDLGAEHNKPLHPVAEKFIEPTEYYKPKFNGEKQIAAGKDILFTTERTLNATLKSYGMGAFGGFLNHDARVIFPGYEPIIGKDKAIAFYYNMVSKMTLKTTQADKASGGDLAYTYGIATIDYKTDLRESFNYVFIYERQKDHNWNLIQQIYTPAER